MSVRLMPLAVVLSTLSVVACSPKPSSTPATSTPAASEAAAVAPAPAAATAPAPAAAQQGSVFKGTIAETMNSGGYTYAQLKDGAKDVWIAGPEFDAKVGETVSVALDMPMQNFESKTLKRTFPIVYFVAEVARNGQPLSGAGNGASASGAAAPAMATGHGGAARDSVKVEKMEPPAGGLSVADVFARKTALSGKNVTVRGTVVKYNGGILDRNWLHIQDGSGSADAHNNDLTITSDAAFKVGDVVTLSGVVGTNKDFGAGYAYDVIVERAAAAK